MVSNAFQRLEAWFLRSPVECNYTKKYPTKTVECYAVVNQINCVGKKLLPINSNYKRNRYNKMCEKGFFIDIKKIKFLGQLVLFIDLQCVNNTKSR